jgi:enoyl-[acyl-carrier-protein] reductase (NADH)
MTPAEYFTEIVKTRTPLQRLQTPEDMGHSVVFLASEDSRNITGHSFYVDGGQVMY